jgi:hypothetical protein
VSDVSDGPAAALEHDLAATPECVPLERLAETLGADEQRHVDNCVRCQSELALFREFEESPPASGEGADVSSIVAALARRQAATPDRTARTRFAGLTSAPWRWTMAAAALAFITTGVYLMRDREPAVREISNSSLTYRVLRLDVRGPVGDVASAPTVLEWVAPKGAVSYDVDLLEVDRKPLWRTTSSVSHVDLPAFIVRQLVPGKAVLWEVRAKNGANHVVAESGTQEFRVAIAGSSPRD